MTATDPETGAALDKDAVRDELVLFLLAGHETTAIALVSALHCVGADAEVQHRIRREVREVCGTRLPTATDLDSLPYTTAAVQEALRLYPPVHTLVRRATESDTLGGRAVPTGRVIAVNVWGLHRNSAVWRDPTRFDPGRFVGGQQQRYSFLPFGGGPHGCVGGRLAMRELVAAVATIVGAVELTPTAPLAVQAGLTVRPLGPVRAHVQRVLT
jgi:cytochrome P450